MSIVEIVLFKIEDNGDIAAKKLHKKMLECLGGKTCSSDKGYWYGITGYNYESNFCYFVLRIGEFIFSEDLENWHKKYKKNDHAFSEVPQNAKNALRASKHHKKKNALISSIIFLLYYIEKKTLNQKWRNSQTVCLQYVDINTCNRANIQYVRPK